MRAHFPAQRLVIFPIIAMDGKEGHGLRLEKGWPPFLFIMTVAAPLSAFLMFISELFFSSVIAFLSFSGRLGIVLVIGVCASCSLISFR